MKRYGIGHRGDTGFHQVTPPMHPSYQRPPPPLLDPHTEHRITVLEETQYHHAQEIDACKDIRSIIGKVGWALATMAITLIIYMTAQTIKSEIWTMRGDISQDVN